MWLMNSGSMDGRGRTRVAMCPDYDRAVIRYVSCVMPETTGFKVGHMPPPLVDWPEALGSYDVVPGEPDSGGRGLRLRILVVAGNLSHFAGDLDKVLWEHWRNQYEMMVYVPGPFDYGSGTVRTGDIYCTELEKAFSTLTVLNHHAEGCHAALVVEMAMLNLRIVGAPMWPGDAECYKDAKVYHPGENNTEDMANVDAGRLVGKKLAQERLEADLDVVLAQARLAREKDQALLVVSHGCPDEALCCDVRDNHPFKHPFVAPQAFYREVLPVASHGWIYGAAGNKEVQPFLTRGGEGCMAYHLRYDSRKTSVIMHDIWKEEGEGVIRLAATASEATK